MIITSLRRAAREGESEVATNLTLAHQLKGRSCKRNTIVQLNLVPFVPFFKKHSSNYPVTGAEIFICCRQKEACVWLHLTHPGSPAWPPPSSHWLNLTLLTFIWLGDTPQVHWYEEEEVKEKREPYCLKRSSLCAHCPALHFLFCRTKGEERLAAAPWNRIFLFWIYVALSTMEKNSSENSTQSSPIITSLNTWLLKKTS